ncbi:MAG TPA: peptidylprolyl isomerase [Candidatus Binatia bacterium]|jgi:peptidyl-prolyl cis-trans isomerase SurA
MKEPGSLRPRIRCVARRADGVVAAVAAATLLAVSVPALAAPHPAAPAKATPPPAAQPAAQPGQPDQPPPPPAALPPAARLEGDRIHDGIVAVVDGDPITLRELKRYGVIGAPFLPPDVRNDYRALLESMIERKLLKSEFEKNGINAPDDMVNRYIDGVLEETRQTRDTLQAEIAKSGITWKDYFERMREEVERIQLINLLIRSRVNVPEEEVRKAWEDDPKYLEGERLEVAAIFLPGPTSGEEGAKGRDAADKVRKEAKRDFEDAAKKYSKGPAASDGGRLGEFKRGSMASQYEKALAGLGKGDVSDPVDGPGGFYIVKVVDIKASGRKPFDQVKDELSKKLYDERLEERYKKWAKEDLRKDHHIVNLVDNLALTAAGS